MAAMDRYAGKPMLKLLEAWIMDEAGALPPAVRAQLERMTPQLQATFRSRAGWKEIVAAALSLGPEHAAEVAEQWARWQAEHPRADAVRFAQEFADALTAP